MIVAHSGNRSVEEAKNHVSSTEFVRWAAFFDEDWKRRNVVHDYLAALRLGLYELLQTWVKGLPNKKLEDFQLEYVKKVLPVMPEPNEPKRELTELEKQKLDMIKVGWMAFVGMRKDGSYTSRRPPYKRPRRPHKKEG